MTEGGIKFVIEGPAENDQNLELSVFVEKAEQFNALLKNTLKEYHRKVVINVVGLSHSSPSTVECQLMTDGQLDNEAVIACARTLDLIESKEIKGINSNVLSSMEKLAKPEPGKVARGEIRIFGKDLKREKVYRLDKELLAKLQREPVDKYVKYGRNEEYAELSMIDGVLQQIDIRRRPYTCVIDDAGISQANIKCEFSEDLLDSMGAALGRNVFIYGEFFYRRDNNIPYKIGINEVEILPPSEELPSLSDLKGVAPGLTGDMAPEEFVRKLRDSWYEDKE